MAAALALSVAVVAGCSGGTAPAGSGTAASGDSAPTKPNLEILSGGSGSLLLWVADQQGYLREHGLQMNLEQVLQFSTIIESLSSNQADAAPNSWVSVISAASAAPGPKIVLTTSLGFPVSLVIKPDVAARYGITATGPFTDLSRLKDSHVRVSAGNTGEATYIWLTAIAKDAGLTAGPEPTNDLVLIPGPAGPPQITQWNQNDVDVLFTPDEFVASAGLSENVSIPVGRTAPIFDGIGGAGLVVSESMLQDHPETVQALVDASYQSLDWLADPANRAAVTQLMVANLRMPQAGAEEFYDKYVSSLAQGPERCATDAQFEGALALANAGRPAPISVPKADVIDSSFCEAAAGRYR